VDDVQVDVVDPEPLQAALDLGDRVLPPRKELGRDEHVLARNAALAQRLSDALLVAVSLRGINVPAAELKRPGNGIYALAAIRHLPDTKAEQRDLVAVRQHARNTVYRPHTRRKALGHPLVPT
jgi:hypothetical protein